MNQRYRHWIQPANGGKWPSAILCVDAVPEGVTSEPVSPMRTERLASWNAVCLQSSNGGYYPSIVSAGCDGPALLDMIGSASLVEGNLWVVSYQCGRVWSLLRIWEAIENGTVQISGADYRNSQQLRERLREYRRRQEQPLRPVGGEEVRRLAASDSGYLVVEDPPNILRGRFHRQGKQLTWIDIRNHGVDVPADVMPGAATCRWLAVLVKRMCELCRSNGLTALKATAGSQAMAAWRHSHYKGGVYVHTDGSATGTEQRGYYGGRCEASRIGVVTAACYHVDFRSQYGWCCAGGLHPARLSYYRDGSCGETSLAVGDGMGVIADVGIETDEPAYPVRIDDGTVYPVGRFRTTLCGPELADAQSHGRIRSVHTVAVYEMADVLREYALAMYALRCREEVDGVAGSATWVKKLIVGLPGKLGQLSHRWVDCPDVMPQSMYGEWYGEGEEDEIIRYRSMGGNVQRDVVDGYAADSVPAMAGWITSFARVRLLDAIRCAGWQHVYYIDTDSLIVDEAGYERLHGSEYMTTTGMGFLTLKAGPCQVEIRGVKHYVQDGKVTCAGLAKGNITDAGDGVHFTRHLTPAEQIRGGKRPDAVLITGTYLRCQAYGQGTVLPDGRVVPLVINEW